MRTSVMLLLVAMCVPAFADEKREDERLAAFRAEVRTLDAVTGDAVGYAGTEGAFMALYKKIRAADDAGLFEALLAEKSPVAKALGLYGLVQMRGERAAQRVLAFLHARERFQYLPHGCCGSTIPLGQFARTLLAESDPLRSKAKREPLVEPQRILSVDLRVLASNESVLVHRVSARALAAALKAKTFELTWPGLATLEHDLSFLELIRAVGRMSESSAQRAFLVAALRNRTLPPSFRLAAASALTRSSSGEAKKALEAHRNGLDKLSEHRLGTRFLDIQRKHAAFLERWEPIDRVKTWKGMEAIAEQVRVALKADHPFALERLIGTDGMSLLRSHPAVRSAHTKSLLDIARGLEDTSAMWNTWATAPYRLEAFLTPGWNDEDLGISSVSEETRKTLRELLHAHFTR